MAAKQAEEARAQEKAARQQRHKEQQAAAAAAAVSRPEAGAGKAEGRLNVGHHTQVHDWSIVVLPPWCWAAVRVK